MTILVTAHHSCSLGVPRRWSPQGLAGWGLRLLQWVWGSGGAGDEARRALWACSELPDQNLLTGSPPGCSLPSPPSCPRTSLRMVSLYLPHCLPPSHLLCTASEQVNKCACSYRPPTRIPCPLGAAVWRPLGLVVAWPSLIVPALHPPPAPTARLFHLDPFARRSPHHGPSLHDQKMATPKFQEILFLLKNMAYAHCRAYGTYTRE